MSKFLEENVKYNGVLDRYIFDHRLNRKFLNGNANGFISIVLPYISHTFYATFSLG